MTVLNGLLIKWNKYFCGFPLFKDIRPRICLELVHFCGGKVRNCELVEHEVGGYFSAPWKYLLYKLGESSESMERL